MTYTGVVGGPSPEGWLWADSSVWSGPLSTVGVGWSSCASTSLRRHVFRDSAASFTLPTVSQQFVYGHASEWSKLVSNWSLRSCQPRRVASGQLTVAKPN